MPFFFPVPFDKEITGCQDDRCQEQDRIRPEDLGEGDGAGQKTKFLGEGCPPGMYFGVKPAARDESQESRTADHAAASHFVQGADNAATSQHHTHAENQAADNIGE